MLKEFNGLQVLVASVLIGNPLAFLASIVQVEHGCNRIHPQPVHMVLLHPVKGVADQEILYFIFAVVKHLGAPIRVFALAGVSVFEQGLSVKISQSMGVLGEMGRNPVQDDADSGAVEIIHKIHEVLWRAVPGGGCKISGYLITPGTVKWMFCDAHQFNMGITHLLHIGRQFMGRLGVCIEPVLFFPVFLAPRTKV